MKKWLGRIVLGLLTIFVLLYSSLMYRSHTPVPVNDDELRLERASISAGSNAFDGLQAAGRHLWWPDQQNQALSDLARNTNWDETLANTLLASNREALAGWDAAAKLADLQVPEVSRVDEVLPYLEVWKELSEIAAVRENSLLHSKHDREAFDDILTDIQMSDRMQNSHGPFVCYFLGMAIGKTALSKIPLWLGRTHLEEDQLKSYIQQLSSDPDDSGNAFANTIKAEYKIQIGILETVRDGKFLEPDTGAFCSRLSTLLPLFNFSRTKDMYANYLSLLVNAAPHHYNEAQLPDLESNRPGLVSMVMSGNAIGQIVYYMIMPGFASTLAKKSQVDVQLQSTRAILALRAYQLVHGRLPSNLSALMPEFLDKMPADDFDGQPLRYSAERKIVYSVGKNLKDDGGDDKRGNLSQPPLDQVCHFDF